MKKEKNSQLSFFGCFSCMFEQSTASHFHGDFFLYVIVSREGVHSALIMTSLPHWSIVCKGENWLAKLATTLWREVRNTEETYRTMRQFWSAFREKQISSVLYIVVGEQSQSWVTIEIPVAEHTETVEWTQKYVMIRRRSSIYCRDSVSNSLILSYHTFAFPYIYFGEGMPIIFLYSPTWRYRSKPNTFKIHSERSNVIRSPHWEKNSGL